MTGKIVVESFKIIMVTLFIYVIDCLSCSAVNQAFEEKRVAITKAFKVAFNIPLPDQFEPLMGGFSSPGIYRVFINGKPYVLRLSHPQRTLKDEQRTISCIKISAKRGLSPKLYYASAEDGIVIMDYYDKDLYKERHLIECFFGEIKYFRRIFSRFDKTAQAYMGFLNVAAIFIWLK